MTLLKAKKKLEISLWKSTYTNMCDTYEAITGEKFPGTVSEVFLNEFGEVFFIGTLHNGIVIEGEL